MKKIAMQLHIPHLCCLCFMYRCVKQEDEIGHLFVRPNPAWPETDADAAAFRRPDRSV